MTRAVQHTNQPTNYPTIQLTNSPFQQLHSRASTNYQRLQLHIGFPPQLEEALIPLERQRALARRILERDGFTVLEARDGREAIRVAAGYPSRIDLLVTDMVMPNVGGTELFAHLRLLRPDLRVLFVSGYTDDDIIRRGLQDAGSAFLQKPFTATGLAAAARAALVT